MTSTTRCMGFALQLTTRAFKPLVLESALPRLSGVRCSHQALPSLWTCGSLHTSACDWHHNCHQRRVSLPITWSSRDDLNTILKTGTSLQSSPSIAHSSILQRRQLLPLVRSVHKDTGGGNKQAQKQYMFSLQGFVNSSPPAVKPYLRLSRFEKPIGTWLLYLPCTFSISLASPPGCLPDLYMLGLFGLGSVLMRGAGCTINDMWDRDFDKKCHVQVARTRGHPLASGELTYFKALGFLALQLSGALSILLTMNWPTVALGASSMLLVITYPLMKRFTFWPQAFLGITLNWGVLVSWSGICSHLGLPPLLLYISCILWTLIYDTIYSHQDKADDQLIGVKSTALRFGQETKYWLTGFASIMVGCLTTVGCLCEQTWPYYAGVAMVAGHLGVQIYTVDLDNPEDCGHKFRSNRNLGLMFWAMIVAANLLKKDKKETESEMKTGPGAES